MAETKDLRSELLDVLDSGHYGIVRTLNDGPEDEYEGCNDNLWAAIHGRNSKVRLLNDDEEHARPGHRTFALSYPTFLFQVTLYIWEE